VQPLPTPAPRSVDASRRAWRTFIQGLLTNIAIWLAPVLLTAVGTLQWTRQYWITLGVTALTAVVTAIFSYLGRFLVPPQVSDATIR
jgi:hypothetical protein